MEARNVMPVILMRKSRKLRVAADRKLQSLRNLVERCFSRLKNSSRVAIRYDRTAERPPKDLRKLFGLHRHHVDPALAPPFVTMT